MRLVGLVYQVLKYMIHLQILGQQGFITSVNLGMEMLLHLMEKFI